MKSPITQTFFRAVAFVTFCAAAATLANCGTKQDSADSSKQSAKQMNKKASSLPSIKVAPSFTGTHYTNTQFQSQQLRGSVWVAYFFFSSCAGPCPIVNQHVADLHKTFTGKNVKFVGISVDPDNDTPAVLANYARRFNADPTRWFMLQMPMDSVKTVAVNGFLLAQGAMNNAEDDPNLHSTRLALVDKQGMIRGYYDGLDSAGVPKLTAAIVELLQE